ncbi:fimbria/pilus periplasmic chaperone [Comamonas composti]|uniref:fimbria/pilus periplasmic chaperone n=1 Tax=Comamonas composti TaxID=408558 RepID=UPI000420151F|nr:fimbria/pilus periplasmic chaperone [Comamonas composti]
MKIKKIIKTAATAICAAWLSYIPALSQASVVIGGTRVVYEAKETEVTLKLTNPGQSPALVQAWVDAGNTGTAPADINVPFTVTPPMSRLDPTKAQTLRIVYTGEPLPTDRESVFWLNVLEIPPKPSADEADTNKIQLAFRSRIKLFYRPADLKGKPEEAASQLRWKLIKQEGKPAIEVHNPTPFHVSLTEISVHSAGKQATFDDGGMVDPGKTEIFVLKGEASDVPGASVHHRSLNDYGGPVEGQTLLHPEAPGKTQ